MAKATKQTAAQTTTLKLVNFASKSEYIRALAAQGMSRGAIVKHFETVDGIKIRYQHVRNVLITPIKRQA